MLNDYHKSYIVVNLIFYDYKIACSCNCNWLTLSICHEWNLVFQKSNCYPLK